MATPLEAVSRLSSRVLRVLGCNPSPMTLQGTNTYIVGTGRERLLIDTGDRDVFEYFELLNDVVHQNNLKLTRILITHWHPDHINGVNGVLKFFGLEPGKGPNGCLVHKFEDKINDVRSEVEKFDYLKDGDEIEVEGATLKVIHTPGHSEDHLVAVLKEENALFSGDCILGEGTTVFENLHDYMKSLEKIKALNPSVIYPGHGPVINDPVDRITEYIRHRMEREKQIYAAIPVDEKEAITAMNIVKTIYVDTPLHLHVAAMENVKLHLGKLIKDGKVKVKEGTVMEYYRA